MATTVTFTIEVTNLVNSSPKVTYDNVEIVDGENLYKAMCKLEKTPGSGFTFKSEVYESYGHFITSINGLDQDTDKKNYWRISIEKLGNWAEEGVDWIKPKQDEKYIFAYAYTPSLHANKMK